MKDEEAVTESHRRAILAFLAMTHRPKTTDAILEMTFSQACGAGNPFALTVPSVFRAWLRKVLDPKAMHEALVPLHARTFTEEEVGALVAFHSTPLGQKCLDAMPAVVEEGNRIALERAIAMQGELIRMVQEAKEPS